MNPTPDELPHLIHACLDGRATAEEATRLNALLRGEAAARDLYLQLADTHSCLAVDEQLWSAGASPADTAISRFPWLPWRPLMAAAAGLVLGLFSAGLVFAYVAPSLGASEKGVSLLEESFEAGPAPLLTGVPVEPGHWSGDFAEVVDGQQGVKPASGRKMLRFLRADYEGKPIAKGSRVADLYRLIDVRPYRHEFADGSAVVQLSAGFNAFEYPSNETYIGTISIHALDAESVTNGSLRAPSARDETSLAVASAGLRRLNRTPSDWQRLTSDLRLPANTDFLLIHILIPAGRGTLEKAGFGGHYIDDVRLTLRNSPLR